MVGSISDLKSLGNLANDFIKEAEIDLITTEKLISNLDLSKCELDEKVFGIERRALYNLQQASEKAVKALILIYFKPMFFFENDLITNESGSSYGLKSEEKNFVKPLKQLDKKFTPEKIGHSTSIPFMCLTEEIINNQDRIKNIILRKLRFHFHENRIHELEKNLDISLKKLSLEPKRQKRLERICKEWKKGNWMGVKSELGYMIPCIEHSLEALSKQLTIRSENDESISEEVYQSLNELIKQQIDNIARESGSKEKGELVLSSFLDWFNAIKESVPSISYVISYAFTVSECLWIYESIGRYPRDARFEIDVYMKRNEVCQDAKNIDELISKVKELVNTVNSLVGKFNQSLSKLESVLQTN